MIIGHGIDLQEMGALEQAVLRHPSFVKKVLTVAELTHYQELTGRRQLEYLAGRWAAKEALAKALGTGIGKIGFQDMEVLADDSGAPVMTCVAVKCRIWVSISHSANFVEASVILEEHHDK